HRSEVPRMPRELGRGEVICSPRCDVYHEQIRCAGYGDHDCQQPGLIDPHHAVCIKSQDFDSRLVAERKSFVEVSDLLASEAPCPLNMRGQGGSIAYWLPLAGSNRNNDAISVLPIQDEPVVIQEVRDVPAFTQVFPLARLQVDCVNVAFK